MLTRVLTLNPRLACGDLPAQPAGSAGLALGWNIGLAAGGKNKNKEEKKQDGGIGSKWLPPRDSNPDKQIQNLLSCH
jgi:hypothetical protein